jgi:ABC-type antimicrobial peptide transport system permease subunit
MSKSNYIEVDESQIKDKENFNFLSTIAKIISYLVIIFGSVTVSLFVFNLLKMHLNKVKMNIGTFMAIGLGNKESRNIYFAIIGLFIIVGLAASFLFAWAVGYGINKFFVPKLNVEKDVTNYFNLLSVTTVIAIAIFLISSMLVSWITINRILSKSPGDLIYNR